MECIKTGCVAHLEPYEEYVYGDLFRLHNNLMLMRVCERQMEAPARWHTRIYKVEYWFDETRTSGEQNSTLIGRMDQFLYEGWQV
jgi:hypothetical protein